jgi:serine phosphatase RsbU (regulator of sigma subunit)
MINMKQSETTVNPESHSSLLPPIEGNTSGTSDVFTLENHPNNLSALTQIWLLDCDSTFPAERLTSLNQLLMESNLVVSRLDKGKVTSYQQLEQYLQPQTTTWLLASEGAFAQLATDSSSTIKGVEPLAQLAIEQLGKHPVLGVLQCLLFSEEPIATDSLKRYLSAGIYKVLSASLSVNQWVEQLMIVIKLGEKLRSSEAFAKEQACLNADLANRSLMIEKELYKTRQLQQSLLPAIVETENAQEVGVLGTSKLHYLSDKLRITGLYIPCDAIGGDLYDFCEFQDGSLGVIITDVSGHGVPAAFVTALLKASFYRITHRYQTPDQVLFHLNNQLAAVVKTGDYLTAAYLHFLDEGKTVEYGGAGHPYPLLYRAKTQSVELLEENGTPLVWVPDMPYGMQFTHLEPGDKILLFTDGVTELSNAEDALYGEDRLAELFPQVIGCSPEGGGTILDAILMELSDFAQGHPLNDDLTMLMIEVL